MSDSEDGFIHDEYVFDLTPEQVAEQSFYTTCTVRTRVRPLIFEMTIKLPDESGKE